MPTHRNNAVTGGNEITAMEEERVGVFWSMQGYIPEKFIGRRTSVGSPGYYRPEKKWNLIVVAKDNLVAAVELKS